MWNSHTRKSSIVIQAFTGIPVLSSLAYDEKDNTTIIASHGSVKFGKDMVYTLNDDYFVSVYPSAFDVSIQGSITWNRYQSKGVSIKYFFTFYPKLRFFWSI